MVRRIGHGAPLLYAPRMAGPRVSVVIPAYGNAHFLGEAVQSVLDQTRPADEVIVVDDGSPDESAAVARSFGDAVRLLEQANAGVAAARNAGAAASTGDLLAFLDADDVWLPEKLEKQVARFAETPDAGLVHCGFTTIDEQGRRLETRVEGLEGRAAGDMLHILTGQRGRLHGGGSSMMLTRGAFDESGGFDARLPPTEDWDMTFRVMRRRPIAFVPEPLLLYRQHPGNAHRQIERVERGMMLGFSKAFEQPDPDFAGSAREAYGQLHLVLAGSYWEVGDRRAFARHAARAVAKRPASALRLAGYPLRRLRRAAGSPAQTS
jgi:glycosyltransferase involved in cell wall biosynthesis